MQKHKSLTPEEVNALTVALRMNAKHDEPIGMDPHDTTFDGIVEYDERVIEETLINAVKSVPNHY